jgi:hypothetical protein
VIASREYLYDKILESDPTEAGHIRRGIDRAIILGLVFVGT